jgi:hypothetical protein
MAGFEPALSSTPSWRIAKLSHILKKKRPGGFEPPHPPWQGGRLPSYIMDAFTSPMRKRGASISSGGWN